MSENVTVNPKVSILMPVHKITYFTNQAIRCAVNQTYQDIHLYIIDNSEHGTFELDNSLKDLRKKITVLKANEKRSAAYARNIGLSKIKSKYVAFVDSDDYVDQNHISEGVKFLDNYSNKKVVYSTAYVNSDNGKLEVRKSNSRITLFTICTFCPVSLGTSIMHRNYDIEIPEYKSRHDLALWIKLYKLNYYFHVNNEILMTRNIHKNNLSKRILTNLVQYFIIFKNEANLKLGKNLTYISILIARHLVRKMKIIFS